MLIWISRIRTLSKILDLITAQMEKEKKPGLSATGSKADEKIAAMLDELAESIRSGK